MVVCCEYDALPGIGHGCGHNVIGTAGVGAGIALAPLVEALGGRLTVLGTPAEEGGGGKVRLLERGAFADADVAMMIHPEPANVEYVPYLANETLIVQMHGKAAHASSSARAGVNALDALVLGYQATQVLRGLLRRDERVFGIITDGGVIGADTPITIQEEELLSHRWTAPEDLDRYLRPGLARRLRAGLAALEDGTTAELVDGPR